MNIKFEIAKTIVETLKKDGHEALFAGGCVRDRLRNVDPKDFDIATSAKPDQVQQLFTKTVPVGAQFGVILVIEQNNAFEVATFRSEANYTDGRHPETVSFTSVKDDASRRDFTVNGLYWDPISDQILDFVNGQADLKAKLIRTIGDPEQRFLEDHLRMFRAVRFAVQLGFVIHPQTIDAIKKHAALINKVSPERIKDELTKTLTSKSPADGIRLLDDTGLLPYILPEALSMKGVEQPKEYHPEGDVFIHTLLLLSQLSEPPIELAMGALLHDIGKPATFFKAPDRIRFNGHDNVGAEMSRAILKRLAFPNAQIDLICSLVAEHLRFKDVFKMRVSTLKRFLSLHSFDLHLALHKIDCMASHGNLDAYHFSLKKYEELKASPPPPLKLVTGRDLINLGLTPGPKFSAILRAVEDAVLEGTITTNEQGIEFVKANFLMKGS